jgi:HSP20 family protein
MSMLTRWDPFNQLWREMHRIQEGMGRAFDQWTGRRPGLAGAFPALNLWEDNDFVYAEAELPGMNLQDIEMFVTGEDQLTLKGKRVPSGPEKAVWHRQERGFGSFERVLTLPVPVNADRVDARFENGVLTIKMAKSEAAKPRKITVKGEEPGPVLRGAK